MKRSQDKHARYFSSFIRIPKSLAEEIPPRMPRISVTVYSPLFVLIHSKHFLSLSLFLSSLTELTFSVLLSSFFLHFIVCNLKMLDDATAFFSLLVAAVMLLCACCHVDDVHSTYADFIIMIIVLNSNLLNEYLPAISVIWCKVARMHCPNMRLGCNRVC